MKRRTLKHIAVLTLLAGPATALAGEDRLAGEIRQQGQEALATMKADVLAGLDGRAEALAALGGALRARPAGTESRATVNSEPCPTSSPQRLALELLPDVPRLPTVRAPMFLLAR